MRVLETLAGRRAPRVVLYERRFGSVSPERSFATGAAYAERLNWELTRYRFSDGAPPAGPVGWTEARRVLREGWADMIVTTSLGTLTAAEPEELHSVIEHMRLLGQAIAVVHHGVRTAL